MTANADTAAITKLHIVPQCVSRDGQNLHAYDLTMEIARLYRAAQSSFVELVEGLHDDEWATRVPCNPDWTVSDVLSHVAGVTFDIAEGAVGV
jgi:hypothetical protein